MANHVYNEKNGLIHRPTNYRVTRFLEYAGVGNPRKWIEENFARDLKRDTVLEEI